MRPDRRLLIVGAAALGLSSCDRIVRSDAARCTVKKAEGLTRRAQRALTTDCRHRRR